MARPIFPEDIQIIGQEVAIRWSDESENFYSIPRLRELSPSAENTGETDLFGKRFGGVRGPQDYSGVTIKSWQIVGGYAVAFAFSDGHRTGLYTFQYLKEIANEEAGE